jgi:exodeoxyribonuclease VII large subunit
VASHHRALAGFPQKVRTQQQMVDEYESRLQNGLRRYYQIQQRKLANTKQKMSPAQLRHLIEVKRSRLSDLISRLRNSATHRIHTCRRAIERHEAKLGSLSPLAVLERGYSITCTDDGTILKTATQTSTGEAVQVRLHQGQLKCEVKETKNG